MVVIEPGAGVYLFWFRTLRFMFLIISLLPGCGISESEQNSDQAKTDEIDTGDQNNLIPDVPRRMLIKEVEWGNKKTVSTGVSTSFAGAEFEVETEINLVMKFGLGVWVFAPGTKEALIDDGTVFLGNTAQRPFNYICRFEGHMVFDPLLREKLSLFGNGLANEDFNKETTGVVQSSESFKVKIGEKWPDIFKHCKDYGAKTKMLDSVEADLRRMIKGLIYHDDRSSCLTEEHCSTWHSTLLPVVQGITTPVCLKNSKNGQRYCSIEGRKGSACSTYDDKTGHRLTRGLFEYKCTSGLKCETIKQGGWFEYANAECR